MPVDRKALMQKMKAEKQAKRDRVKQIVYPLPDLKGPGGNAFVLISQAGTLMKDAGIEEGLCAEFRAEAMSGDYQHVLKTLQAWFTLAVSEVTYVPLKDDADLSNLRPSDVEATWEEYDEAHPEDESLDEALGQMEENEERDHQVAEAEKRVVAQIRAELGLNEDDIVVVQVKRAKKG